MKNFSSTGSPAIRFTGIIFFIAILVTGCAQLSPEYVIVHFEPDDVFSHAGQCSLADVSDGLQPQDIGVLIEGECHGSRVGEIIGVTTGRYEVSVDVIGARAQIVNFDLTTPANPKMVTIKISAGE